MSVVGPRPAAISHNELYRKHNLILYACATNETGKITGWAQSQRLARAKPTTVGQKWKCA